MPVGLRGGGGGGRSSDLGLSALALSPEGLACFSFFFLAAGTGAPRGVQEVK